MRASVVIPCFNEAHRLDRDELRRLGDSVDVVLVDDGSTDSTRDELQFLAMFHYAVGAMAAMVALVPSLHLFVVTSLTPEGQPIDALLVRLFGERGAAACAGLLLVLGFTLGGLLIAAGLGLARCRNYRLCRTASILGYTNNALSADQRREAITAVLGHAAAGRIRMQYDARPLAEVGQVWTRMAAGESGARSVLIP